MALGSMPTRPALLIRIEDTDGCFGWGEVWANFPPRANLHKAHIIEDVVAPHLRSARFVEPREIGAFLRRKFSIYFLHVGQLEVFEHILAGVDTALWDLALRKAGRSFAEFMGLSESSAQSYATSINADDLERLIPHHASLGQTYFKLKIGFAEHGNREIVERAARLCPERVTHHDRQQPVVDTCESQEDTWETGGSLALFRGRTAARERTTVRLGRPCLFHGNSACRWRKPSTELRISARWRIPGSGSCSRMSQNGAA